MKKLTSILILALVLLWCTQVFATPEVTSFTEPTNPPVIFNTPSPEPSVF